MDNGGCFNVFSLKRARNLGGPPCQRKQVPEEENRGGLSGRAGGDSELFNVAFSQRDCSEGGPGSPAEADEAFAGLGEGGLGAKVKPQ